MNKINSNDEKEQFLREIRRRRDLFWLSPVIYFVTAVTIGFMYSYLFGGKSPSVWFGYLYLSSFIIGGHVLTKRISEIRCPNCKKMALRKNPIIFMKHVQCQWCGYPRKD